MKKQVKILQMGKNKSVKNVYNLKKKYEQL